MKLKDLRTPFSQLSERQQLALLEGVRANRHQVARKKSLKRSVPKETGATLRPSKPKKQRKPRTMQELEHWMLEQMANYKAKENT